MLPETSLETFDDRDTDLEKETLSDDSETACSPSARVER